MRITELNFFFQQLKEASLHKKLFMDFRATREIKNIAEQLQTLHFLSGYRYSVDNKRIQLYLSYDLNGHCVLQDVVVVSSAKKRLLLNKKEVFLFLNDYPYSTALVRTTQGILNIQTCLNRKIGGELLAYIK